MPTTAPGIGLTFGLACVSAAIFLRLRSEGKGHASSPHSRWWALAVIAVTGVLSTGAALVLVFLAHHLFPAVVSLGVLAPSTLWVAEIQRGSPERHSPYRDALTLWVSWLLCRMDEGITEDREGWCRQRIVPGWTTDELIMAAHYYHDYLRERLPATERQRYRISSLIRSIEAKLDIARLIDDNPRLTNGSAGRAKLNAALTASRLPQERYRRSLDDLARLARMLRSDARQDMTRLLRAAYRSGLRRLPAYQPPPGPEPPMEQRAHP